MPQKYKIEKSLFEELVKEGLSSKMIAERLKVSWSYAKKALLRYGLKTRSTVNNKFCKICGKVLVGRQSLYCSHECKRKSLKLNEKSYTYLKKRGLQRKISFIQKLGGKCSICGYNKNLSALVFHHLNPDEKRLSLDMRAFSGNRYELIEEEVDKCILLCSNCHMELHHPQLNFNEDFIEGIIF